MEFYSENGLVLHDPTVRWGFEHTGSIAWHELEPEDSHGVFRQARRYGLIHGTVIALVRDGSRSVASFARDDREHSEDEKTRIAGILERLHTRTASLDALSPEERAELRQLSVNLTHGI